MRKSLIAVIGFLTASNLIAMPQSSLAAAIYWIDHIAKADDGIDIYFVQNAALRVVVRGTKTPTFSATYTVSNGVIDDGGRTRDHLFVTDGDEVYASQLVEDSCSYDVTANEAVGKVTAKSAMHLPGPQPIYTTQIIRTDGTVSKAEASR